MKIIFENSYFVIIDKPALVLSIPGRMAEDPRPVAGLHLQQQLKKKVFPVHRLDYEVSGLLIFALDEKAHAAANAWFENKQIQKIYQAITEGQAPTQTKFEWKCKLLRGKKRAYESPAGKDSVTQALFVGQKSEGLLWQLHPVTGRSHQLRYEMYRHQFSILGDNLYGSQKTWPTGIALRAVQIIFPMQALDWGLPPEIKIEGLFT